MPDEERDMARFKNKIFSFLFKVAEVSNPLLLTTNISMPDEIKSNDKRSIKKSEVSN